MKKSIQEEIAKQLMMNSINKERKRKSERKK